MTTRAATDTHSGTGPLRSLPVRALAIDDHFINREMITSLLEHLGCSVESAADGMQAYVAYSKTRFDIVFMDCQMPRMDGYQTTRSIREHERKENLPRVPIIALTANLVGQDRERCVASGMNEVLAKPVTLKQLKALIEHWVYDTPKVVASASPAQPAALDLGPIDVAALDAIRGIQRAGGPPLLISLLDDYLETSPGKIEQLTQALRTGQARTASELAHGLKSISATLGARELAELFAEIEQWAGAKPAPDQLDALRNLFAPACQAFERIREHERARRVAAK